MKERILKYYKPSDYRGFFLKRYFRFIGIMIAKVLSKTSITPNQVSLFRGLLLIPTTYLFIIGSYVSLVAGGTLLLFLLILDYADGSLARIKSMKTEIGKWLSGFDNIMVPLSFFGIGLGLYLANDNPNFLIAAFVANITHKYLSEMVKDYRNISGDANLVIAGRGIKSKIIGNLFYGDYLVITFIFVMSIFNLLGALLYFFAIYGTISLIAVFLTFYYRLSKNKRLTRYSK
ncbi:CDP-alcohol phosphatidyltransferase family protein [Candidatus Woesearchaeota archaeon]|nr:CDP-alcohol phosphatidyltransferase family protein [Candidatus Woesearchaeota archaeon]